MDKEYNFAQLSASDDSLLAVGVDEEHQLLVMVQEDQPGNGHFNTIALTKEQLKALFEVYSDVLDVSDNLHPIPNNYTVMTGTHTFKDTLYVD